MTESKGCLSYYQKEKREAEEAKKKAIEDAKKKDDEKKDETKKPIKKKARTHEDLKAEALVDKATTVATSLPSPTPMSNSVDACNSAIDSDKEDLVILSALTTSTIPEQPTASTTPNDSEAEGSVAGEEDTTVTQPSASKSAEKWVNVKSTEMKSEQEATTEATTEGN